MLYERTIDIKNLTHKNIDFFRFKISNKQMFNDIIKIDITNLVTEHFPCVDGSRVLPSGLVRYTQESTFPKKTIYLLVTNVFGTSNLACVLKKSSSDWQQFV